MLASLRRSSIRCALMVEKRKAENVEKEESGDCGGVRSRAMKVSEMANSNGKPEASRCVEAHKISILVQTKEDDKERLEGLTKHKYHKICNAASALLH